MKRPAIGLATGALSIFLLAPGVKAQSWQDRQADRAAIKDGHEHLRYDRQELRDDFRNVLCCRPAGKGGNESAARCNC
jgi:hypothetical protein